MTFLEMQNQIGSFLMTVPHPTLQAVAGSGINIAIDEMNGKIWNFTLTTSGFPFQSGVTDYAFTSGVRATRNFSYTDTNGVVNGRFKYYDPKSFEQSFPDRTATGTPTAYTLYESYPYPTIALNCVPSADFVTNHPSGIFRYNARIPNLLTSGDSLSNLPPEAINVIMWNARAITSLSYDQEQKVDFAQRKYVDAYRTLRSQQTENELRDFRV